MGRTFENAVLHRLRRGGEGERYVLPESAELGLHQELRADLETRDPALVVGQALRLAAALDGTLRSPTAAALIRRVLQRDRAVVALIRRRVLRPSGLDERRAFERREGRQGPIRAPLIGVVAPKDAIPLKTLLHPGGGGGSRATRRLRG